jgi:hypothetical protein
MKPKSNLEYTVFNLHGKLKPISEKQLKWGYAKCFDPKATINRSTINCLECGHSWKDKHAIILLAKIDQSCMCPNCNQKLILQQTAKRKFKSESYFSIISVCDNFQVIRYFILKKHYRTKTPSMQYTSEVMQHWMNDKGKITYLAKSCSQHPYYYDNWQTYSAMQIVKANSWKSKSRLEIVPNEIYPIKQLLPIIKRNGFEGQFFGFLPSLFFKRLITNPIFETLLKCKRMDFASSLPFDTIEKLWPQIKIAIKNNYIPKNYTDWVDLIALLKQFDKDIHSAKYICPSDLYYEHQKYVNKQRIIRQKQQLLEQIALTNKSEKSFIKEKKKYFSLNFQKDSIRIIVLNSVKAFLVESQKLKHCLFSNGYYHKSDSLILSARTPDNEPIETIEVSLNNFKIIQSRGLNNLPTQFHNQIIDIVNENITKITKIHSTEGYK